jgi:hypothetical protein
MKFYPMGFPEKISGFPLDQRYYDPNFQFEFKSHLDLIPPPAPLKRFLEYLDNKYGLKSEFISTHTDDIILNLMHNETGEIMRQRGWWVSNLRNPSTPLFLYSIENLYIEATISRF